MEATTAERYATGGPARELYAQNLILAFERTAERLADDPAIVWAEGDEQRQMTWRELRELETLVVVDGEGGDHTLDELEQMDPDFDPSDAVAEVGPDDHLTLIYTSGTTGPPKGVQL